jgi:hypothetical protein
VLLVLEMGCVPVEQGASEGFSADSYDWLGEEYENGGRWFEVMDYATML